MSPNPTNRRSEEAIPNREELIFKLAAEVEKRTLAGFAGFAGPTELVLHNHQEVQPDDELIMNLLYTEVVALEEQGQEFSKSNLIDRFPALSDRISRLLAFHETLQDEAPVGVEGQLSTQKNHQTKKLNSVQSTALGEEIGQSVSPPLRNRFRIERFEILEKIGQGGMGVVYRARETDLNRMVALKVLRNPFQDSDDRQRLLNEAQAAARLQHPGIVQIHHVGETEGQPYLCFEYIDGVHLGDRLAASTFAADDACQFLQQVAKAIAFAHQEGIIHRDLKPANILIDQTGTPKVADFGLAKFSLENEQALSSGPLTKTGAMVGTICYMAPEQFTGISDDVDHRADIYALGTILYEMLIGRPPHIADVPEQTMYLVRAVEPVPPRKLNPKIPRDVETICLKCLEKNPERRFQSAQELVDEIQRYLSGKPLRIRPTTSFTIAARWCKRRPAIAMLSAVSALLLIALSIGGYWMAWTQQQHAMRLQDQTNRANDAAKLAAQNADEAEKVTQFIITTLGSAHPNRDGRNVTVAERLDDGLLEVEELFPNPSSSKAALLDAIGRTYEALGLYQEALPPSQEAWQLFSQMKNASSSDASSSDASSSDASSSDASSMKRLASEVRLADLLRRLGQYDNALVHAIHARDGLVSVFGEENEESIVAVNVLAQLHAQRGNRQRALEMFAENYERAQHALPRLDNTTLVTLMAYVELLRQLGELDQAHEMIDQVIPDATRLLGPTNLTVIGLKSLSAGLDRDGGNYKQALSKFQEIHKVLLDRLGPDHLRTLLNLNGISIGYSDLGERDKAFELAVEIRDRISKVLGPNHSQALLAELNVAQALKKMDRHQEARGILKTAYQRALEHLGSDQMVTMQLATHFGESLAQNNQVDEAEELLLDATEYFREANVVNPIVRADPFLVLGTLYRRTERFEKAVELYEKCLAIAQSAFADENPMTLTAKNNLANVYSWVDRCDEAIDLYEEVIEVMDRKQGPNHPNTLITKLNLAILYRDEQQPHKAIDILSEVVPVLQRSDSESWLTQSARFQLGRAYLDAQDFEMADLELERAYANMQDLLPQQLDAKRTELANQIKVMIGQFGMGGETERAKIWSQRRERLVGDNE